jgi:ribose transport system ATP-binding protein/rhamnose transport system ATP-binding protein
MQSRRGHDLGWIGLTLPAKSDRPPVGPIIARIEGLNGAAA